MIADLSSGPFYKGSGTGHFRRTWRRGKGEAPRVTTHWQRVGKREGEGKKDRKFIEHLSVAGDWEATELQCTGFRRNHSAAEFVNHAVAITRYLASLHLHT